MLMPRQQTRAQQLEEEPHVTVSGQTWACAWCAIQSMLVAIGPKLIRNLIEPLIDLRRL